MMRQPYATVKLMPRLGIEPRWDYSQGILSPSRLANFATPAAPKATNGR